MESIYQIKIRSNPNTMELYPSERRYSSSIVLGLSIMFIALGITSGLMGTLVVRRIPTNHTANSDFDENSTEIAENQRLAHRVEEDLGYHHLPHPLNITAMVSAGTFVMCLGLFLAGLMGLLAWKQWYVDNNITWFFLASCFSAVTSSISLVLISVSLMTRDQMADPTFPISLGLTLNIFITSLLGVLWSIAAFNVALKGVKNDYPDDMVLSMSGKGRVEVSTVRKGNKLAKVVPPDILDHFPTSGKLAKFFPKSETGGLPKAESNKEYEERVKRFLSGETDSYNNKN